MNFKFKFSLILNPDREVIEKPGEDDLFHYCQVNDVAFSIEMAVVLTNPKSKVQLQV